MFEISDRITKRGSISFTDVDKAFLATVPPTKETINRAKILGSSLGHLLAANETGEHGRDEVTEEVLTTADPRTSLQVRQAFATSTFIGYEFQKREMAEMAHILRTTVSAEGVTA